MKRNMNREGVVNGLEACSYKQLQKLAKENGVRANAKASQIVSMLKKKGVHAGAGRKTEAAAECTRSGSGVPTARSVALDDLPRRELQRLAKTHGIRANAKSNVIAQELRKLGYAGPTPPPLVEIEKENSILAPDGRREAILRDRAEKWIREKQKARMKSMNRKRNEPDAEWRGKTLAPRAVRQERLEKRIAPHTLELPSPVRKALAPKNWNVPVTNASNLAKKQRKKSVEVVEDGFFFHDSSLGTRHKLLPHVEHGTKQGRKKEYGIKSLRPQRFEGKQALYMNEVAARRQATLAARRNVSGVR